MGHRMVDPVKLPSSGVSMDRSSIERHLLTYSIDPYTRKPLTLAMLVPDVELKARIDEWVATARANRRAKAPVVENNQPDDKEDEQEKLIFGAQENK